MNIKNLKNQSRKTLLVNNKFIYCESIYKLWKNGASLIREKRYSLDKPIKKLSKNDFMKVFKDYKIVRFFDLEEAPLEFINQSTEYETRNY